MQREKLAEMADSAGYRSCQGAAVTELANLQWQSEGGGHKSSPGSLCSWFYFLQHLGSKGHLTWLRHFQHLDLATCGVLQTRDKLPPSPVP